MDEPSRNENNTIILRIKFKSASLEEFTQRYGSDVSPGGIFIKTKQPLDVGTSLQFEFSLADGTPLLFGNGTVAWIRENDPLRSNNSPGMGLRFDKLTPESQQNHQKIVAGKAKAPSRTAPPVSGAQPWSAMPSPVAPATTLPTTSPHLNSPIVDLDKLLDDPTTSESDAFSEGKKTEITDRSFTESILAAEQAKRKTIAEVPVTEAPSLEIPEIGVPNSNLFATEAPSSGIPNVVAPFDDSKPVSSPISLAPPEPDAVVAVDVGTGSIEIPLSMPPSGPVATEAAINSDPAIAESDAPAEELQELSAPLPMEDVPEEVPPERTIENPVDGSLLPKEPSSMRGFAMAPTPVPGTGRAQDSAATSTPFTKPSMASGKWLGIAAVAAAILAFVLVYLFKSKPWEASAPIAQVTTPTPVVAEPNVETPPTATEKAAEPVQTAEIENADKSAKADEPAKVVAPEKTAEPVKPEVVALNPAKADDPQAAAAAGKATPSSKGSKPTESTNKPEEATATAAKQVETYRWAIRSVPANAEVLIDGEYFCRTPCDRRVLDPAKPAVIVLRKVGFEPFERSLGTSETWVKRGKDYFLTVTGKLTKVKPTSTPVVAPAPAASEPKPALTPPPLAPKPEAAAPSAEGATKSKAKPAPDF